MGAMDYRIDSVALKIARMESLPQYGRIICQKQFTSQLLNPLIKQNNPKH